VRERGLLMKPGHQVRAALKVLKPPMDKRAACRAEIKNALTIMGSVIALHNLIKACRSKAHAEVVHAYHRALCGVRTAHRALVAIEKSAIESIAIEGGEQGVAENPVVVGPYELYPGAGGRWRQAFAVALAYELATDWGRSVARTCKGDWWQLAAILYGEWPPLDLYRHILRFEPERSPFRAR
jgi:hypothetical protein